MKFDILGTIKAGIDTYHQQLGREPKFVKMGQEIYSELLLELNLPENTKDLEVFGLFVRVE